MDLSIAEIGLRLLVGCVIGFLIGLSGIGGGALTVPALIHFVGLDIAQAVGTASLYSTLTKSYALFEHIRLKTVSWVASMYLLSGAVPGCLFGVWFVLHARHAVDTQMFDLKRFVAWVMVFGFSITLFDLIRKSKDKGDETDETGGDGKSKNKIQDDSSSSTHLNAKRKSLGVICGVIIGALVGATSVGGGVLVVPVLLLIFGLSTRQTIGSSILIALVLTTLASLLYSGDGLVQYEVAVLMAAGSSVGVFFGSRLSVKLPEKTLKTIVVAALAFATASMFF